ncbi:MAG: class I SAM-dependent methyltransferase [Bryobacteraceae bacterium]
MSLLLGLRRRIVRFTWNRLARRNATYAIVTDPARRESGWSEEDFAESGRRDVVLLFERLGLIPLTFSPMLGIDYGCGIGRCATWLEPHFHDFIAVDISREMLERARARLRPSTRLVTTEELDAAPVEGVTFLFSGLVLQHNPPPVAEAIVERWCRMLAPEGVLVFQAAIAGGQRSYWWPLLLSVAGRNPWFMEMHGLEAARVREILHAGGVELLAEHPDADLEPGLQSRTFIGRKRTA